MTDTKQPTEPTSTSSTPPPKKASTPVSSGGFGKIEAMGEEYFVKKAPFQLPLNGREVFVKFLPWITLVAGLLMLAGAWGIYQLMTVTSGLLGGAYGAYVYGARSDLMFAGWLAVATLLLTALLYFAAFPGLQNRKKSAWKLMVIAELVYLVYGVIWLFGAGNIMSLLSSVLGVLIGLYLLFQVRSYYK